VRDPYRVMMFLTPGRPENESGEPMNSHDHVPEIIGGIHVNGGGVRWDAEAFRHFKTRNASRAQAYALRLGGIPGHEAEFAAAAASAIGQLTADHVPQQKAPAPAERAPEERRAFPELPADYGASAPQQARTANEFWRKRPAEFAFSEARANSPAAWDRAYERVIRGFEHLFREGFYADLSDQGVYGQLLDDKLAAPGPKQAAYFLKRTNALPETTLRAVVEKAKAYQSLGKPDAAFELFSRLIKASPGDFPLRRTATQFFWGSRRQNDSLKRWGMDSIAGATEIRFLRFSKSGKDQEEGPLDEERVRLAADYLERVPDWQLMSKDFHWLGGLSFPDSTKSSPALTRLLKAVLRFPYAAEEGFELYCRQEPKLASREKVAAAELALFSAAQWREVEMPGSLSFEVLLKEARSQKSGRLLDELAERLRAEEHPSAQRTADSLELFSQLYFGPAEQFPELSRRAALQRPRWQNFIQIAQQRRIADYEPQAELGQNYPQYAAVAGGAIPGAVLECLQRQWHSAPKLLATVTDFHLGPKAERSKALWRRRPALIQPWARDLLEAIPRNERSAFAIDELIVPLPRMLRRWGWLQLLQAAKDEPPREVVGGIRLALRDAGWLDDAAAFDPGVS
jgi:hypothetical protein